MKPAMALVTTIDGIADRCAHAIEQGASQASIFFRVLFFLCWALYMILVGGPVLWAWLSVDSKRSILTSVKALLAAITLTVAPPRTAHVNSRLLRFLDRQMTRVGEALHKLDKPSSKN